MTDSSILRRKLGTLLDVAEERMGPETANAVALAAVLGRIRLRGNSRRARCVEVAMTDRWLDTALPQDGVCPWCGHRMGYAGDPAGERGPKRGDFMICIRCGGLGVFTRSLRFRRPTPGEVAGMAPEEAAKVRHWQAVARAIPDDLSE